MYGIFVVLLPTRALGLPQSTEIDQRPDKKFRQGFTGAPVAPGGVRTNNRFPGVLPEGGRGGACSVHGMRVGMCPGVGPEGWLRRFAHPSGGVVCRGHAQYPAFVPNTLFLLQALQKWQLGFVVSLYFLDPEFVLTVYARSYF